MREYIAFNETFSSLQDTVIATIIRLNQIIKSKEHLFCFMETTYPLKAGSVREKTPLTLRQSFSFLFQFYLSLKFSSFFSDLSDSLNQTTDTDFVSD